LLNFPVGSFIFSLIAITISVYTSYILYFKPFDLQIEINPEIHIFHRNDFGMYVGVSFFNDSPQHGSINKLSLVLSSATNNEDHYLLSFEDFKILDTTGMYLTKIQVYKAQIERPPILLSPFDKGSVVASFVYDDERQPFPMTQGTYNCELMLWTRNTIKPAYIKYFKFEMTADLFNKYTKHTAEKSSWLESTYLVGFTPDKSRKLELHEYNNLH
jgi:hypothetical protein